MDPTKKALMAMKKTAKGWREENLRSRLSAADESDDLNELQPSRDAGGGKSPPLPHFLEEQHSPMDFTHSATANDEFDFSKRRKK